jgi:hypothetical protein
MWSSGLHIPSCWTGWTGPGIPRHPAARRPRASCWKSLAKRSKELLIRIPGWDTPSTILGQEFPQAMTISIHNNYSPELPFLKTQHVHTYSSCYTMLYHVIPCYTMLCHVIPCYTMLYHVIPSSSWIVMIMDLGWSWICWMDINLSPINPPAGESARHFFYHF